MIEKLNKRRTKLTWLGQSPDNKKKAALLIPQYNECGNSDDFNSRLEYFKDLSIKYSREIDVIIIDDGSTDDSLEQIKLFDQSHPTSFFIASVVPNANKVGALFLTIEALSHDLIILSDFDTDIVGIELIVDNLPLFNGENGLMGVLFKMILIDGQGPVFAFQQLEYTLSRILYKFHEKGTSVPVMPGAGACYRRDILLAIYKNHSGLRNGEDREATVIGLKMGYNTHYLDGILTCTRPPLTFNMLVKQRIRWNLGYLETIHKERDFYFYQLRKLSRIGLRTFADVLMAFCTLLLPVVLIAICFLSFKAFLISCGLVYISGVIWALNLILISPVESSELKGKVLQSVFLYPIIKLSLDFCAWTTAIVSYLKNRKMQYY